MTQRILIVDDEAPIRDMLRFGLEQENYQVDEAADTGQARICIANARPDLLLLDWMLPRQSGLEFTRSLSRNVDLRDIPILFLTARDNEDDLVAGLKAGADDYLTKPVSMRELLARIQALLRRAQGLHEDEQLRQGDLSLDIANQRLYVRDEAVAIGGTEFRLLAFFMANPDRVYSRNQLLDRIWGHGVYVEERTVDVHILRLRKILRARDAEYLIQTVRGTGYRLSTTPDPLHNG